MLTTPLFLSMSGDTGNTEPNQQDSCHLPCEIIKAMFARVCGSRIVCGILVKYSRLFALCNWWIFFVKNSNFASKTIGNCISIIISHRITSSLNEQWGMRGTHTLVHTGWILVSSAHHSAQQQFIVIGNRSEATEHFSKSNTSTTSTTKGERNDMISRVNICLGTQSSSSPKRAEQRKNYVKLVEILLLI